MSPEQQVGGTLTQQTRYVNQKLIVSTTRFRLGNRFTARSKGSADSVKIMEIII